MHKLRRSLRKLDDGVYAVERVLLLVSVVAMIALVFADVIQRTFSRPVGKTAQVILWLIEGGEKAGEETRALVGDTVGPVVFWILATLFFVAAVQSSRNFRQRAENGPGASAPFGPSVWVGLLVTAGVWVSIRALLWAAPSGIPGAQRFALGFLVWSGFIGASLAVRARRHIVLDAVRKKLSADVGPWFAALGGILTASFCLFLAYMGASKAITEITEWSDSNHVIHTFESVPVPIWLVTLAIPITLTVLSLRFLFAGLGELLFGPPLSAGADEHGIDFEELERQGEGDVAAPAEGAAEEAEEAEPALGWVIGRPHGAPLDEGDEAGGGRS